MLTSGVPQARGLERRFFVWDACGHTHLRRSDHRENLFEGGVGLDGLFQQRVSRRAQRISAPDR